MNKHTKNPTPLEANGPGPAGKKTIGNPVVRFLASLKLTIVLLAAFAVAIGAATFLEVRFGTEGARALVYNALWFEILLGCLIVNLIVSLIAHMPYRATQTGYVITHIAFILVLVSAGITRYFGYEGNMRIREGTSTDFVYSTKKYVQISDVASSASFPVRLYKPGKNHAGRTLALGGDEFDVTVVEYWPRFERRVVESPDGKPVVVFSATGMGGEHGTMAIGETQEIEGVTVHFVGTEKQALDAGPVRGELVIDVSGQTHRLAVPERPPADIDVLGYRFRITEFAPNFRVGETPSPTDPMKNPAIRVRIDGPDGASEERLLFSLHPDFDMGHAGEGAHFEEVDLTYRFDRNVYLFRQADGLGAVADFDLNVQERRSQGAGVQVDGGKRFDARPGWVFHAGRFAFLVEKFWESAAEAPVLSDNPDSPEAVRIEVKDKSGNRAEAIVEGSGGRSSVELGGRTIALYYGPLRIDLPYELYLDKFVLLTYPGSENPASFESHVRIYDEERGVDGKPVRIYMNHPLDYRGFKHFQSSYDRDRKGTILSVNHDPGKLPTYFSYTLVALGFLVTLTRGLVWHRMPNK